MIQLLEIGLSTNVLDNPPDVVASVERLAQDFHAVELELGEAAERAVYDATEEAYAAIVEAIRRVCSERSIYLSVHAPYLDHNLASEDADVRRKSQERLLRAVRIAADLGSDKVTCHPGYCGGRDVESTVKHLISSLERMMLAADALGVRLCLENMGADRLDYIVYSAEQQVRICRATGVGVALDIVHLASVSPEPAAFTDELRRLIPWVRNVHAADMVVPKHVHIPIGEGNLSLTAILGELAAGGYSGPAIVEEFGGPYPTQRFIYSALAYRERLRRGA
ncbi:sugar phosphate isomerase/epimerase family protein [Sorangium sp. So ce381]|uniref:sugar phosphate isomerase/epimerase family protein n=1 Tax=Sorangium sp. So ce381 TaxID=3133307 RepID=UPI003F5B366C